MRNLVAGGPGLAVGPTPGVLEQDLAVPGHQHRPGELAGPGTLGGMLRERRHRVRLRHPVQDEIDRARWPGGDRQLDPAVGIPAGAAEPDVVHPDP